MNYHQPRQVDPTSDRPDAGKWRYTFLNDGRVWTEGYCGQGCPGHDTKEGAYVHQTAYLLDAAMYDGIWADTKRPCEAEGCQDWTEHFALIDHTAYSLCDAHRTPTVVARLFGTVGDSMGSY